MTLSFTIQQSTNIINLSCNSTDHAVKNSHEHKSLKNVLAYSMFGEKKYMERYKTFIKFIAKEALESTLYNTWHVWVYHDGTADEDFIASVKTINPSVGFLDVRNYKVWKLLPVGNNTADITCSRNLDSPLSTREFAAVADWLKSKKLVHVMRDHPMHFTNFMSGLWCFRNHKNRALGKHIVELVLKYAQTQNPAAHREAFHGNDQLVLNKPVWPLVEHETMYHNSYLCSKYKYTFPFPTKRLQNPNADFVGCVRPCKNLKMPVCPLQCRPKSNQN